MSETLNCIQCHSEFHQMNMELFCCDDCRIVYWKTKHVKSDPRYTTDLQINDLKDIMQKSKATANDIRRHLDRIENDYSDWEDRIVAIENKINDLEVELELEEKYVSNVKTPKVKNIKPEFDPIDDILFGADE